MICCVALTYLVIAVQYCWRKVKGGKLPESGFAPPATWSAPPESVLKPQIELKGAG